MPYDPYGPAQEQRGILGTAWDLANPVSIAKYKYTMNPGTWSMSRGVAVPFKGLRDQIKSGKISRIPKYWSSIAKNKGRWSATQQTFKKTLPKWGGEWRLGEELFSKTKLINQTRDELYSQLIKENKGARWFAGLRGKGEQNKLARELTDVYIDQLGGRMDDVTYKFGRNRANLAFTKNEIQRLSKAGLSKEKISILRRGLQQSSKNIDMSPKLLKGLGFRSTLTKATAAKVAIGSMKAVSVIGLATMAFDLAGGIGEPLGRAALNMGDQILGDISNRFNMETGGKLHMAYLSQGAATERQRAIQAISKSYINGRSAMGNEASYVHS